MSEVVLDASALLAMLKGEAGASKVAGVLTGALMSVVNLAEVASHFYKLGMDDGQVQAILRPLPIELVAADIELAWEAGRLRAATSDAGLSLGDRYCLALAKREGAPAWTADRAWKGVANATGVKVTLLR